MSISILRLRPVFRPAPLLAVLAVTAAAVLFFFDPTQSSFYPGCAFHRLTGLLCPGCGCLRALHQLLHGHLATAFHCNPLLVLAMVSGLGLAGALRMSGNGPATGRKISEALLRPAWLWVYLAVVIVFWITRNLPGPWFAWMRP